MSTIHIHSPLYRIRLPLKVLRCIFGFPIQATNETYTKFRFLSWLEFIRFVIMLSMLLLTYLDIAGLILIYDGNLHNFFRIKQECWNNFSTSKIDHIALIIVFVIGVVSSFVYLLAFKSNVESINKLCKDINDLGTTFSMDSNKWNTNTGFKGSRMENSTKTMICGQILCFITSILFGLWAYLILQAIAYDGVFVRYGIHFPIIFPIVYTIETYFKLFGPMTCSAELFCGQIIDSITDLFEDWIVALKTSHEEPKDKDSNTLTLQINMENPSNELKDANG